MFRVVSAASILFHWSICLVLCWCHTVFINVALYYNLKSGIGMPPALFLLLRISLAIMCLFRFHINFDLFFLLLWKMLLVFLLELHCYITFLIIWSFDTIASAYWRTGNVFPFSNVLFDLFFSEQCSFHYRNLSVPLLD